MQVYLLLGSNVGNRIHHLKNAKQAIANDCGRIISESSVYETEPWGLKEQSDFLNCAIEIETELSPPKLLQQLKKLETLSGRKQNEKWGARELDIDILFYGNEIINLPDLKIPHPYISERRFTLVPLNEIASDYIHPVFKKSIRQLLEKCADNGVVTQYKILTE
jgi:2-amino-4-hydroxy-6-hydroxymethyldihydropteridine diphosphokinase